MSKTNRRAESRLFLGAPAGYQYYSLTVGPTENEESRAHDIVAHTDEQGAIASKPALKTRRRSACREYFRCVPCSERDLALSKSPRSTVSPDLMELIKVFVAAWLNVAPESLIVEVSGTVDKIDGLLEVLRPYGRARNGAHRT